jgi:hypothetical protein
MVVDREKIALRKRKPDDPHILSVAETSGGGGGSS